MTIRLPSFLMLLAFSPVGGSAQSVPRNSSALDSPNAPAMERMGVTPAGGTWRLDWDDKVDGLVQADFKTCEVNLTFGRAGIEGSFHGQVLGVTRNASFKGDLLTGSGCRLLVLRQVEVGYVCAYQFQSIDARTYVGVWHDTRGESGDVRLRKIVGKPV